MFPIFFFTWSKVKDSLKVKRALLSFLELIEIFEIIFLRLGSFSF
jgi:hypothetical protein